MQRHDCGESSVGGVRHWRTRTIPNCIGFASDASGDGPPGQTLAGKILPEARFFDSRIYGERDPNTTTKRTDATQVVRG